MLLANLHDDHVTTISILSENVPLDEVFFNEIISFTDHNIANEKMLNAIVMAVSSDTDLRGFCQLVKNLVKIQCRFSREMLEFEIGKVYVAKATLCMYIYTHSCMYVCMHVHMYVRMYVRIYICIRVCIYVCMYARTYVRMYVCM